MKLIALVNFYDESPELLAQMLAGVELLQCEQLVAVDGAYELYPDGKPRSDYKQRAMIDYACHDMQIGLTLVTPASTWVGDEVAKRNALFRYGQEVAEPGDWFVILDSDTVVIQVPEDLRDRLAATEHDVATMVWRDVAAVMLEAPGAPEWISIRSLFRVHAEPIRVWGNHYTYIDPDDRVLWGEAQEVEALKLPDLVGEHRRQKRPQERWQAQGAYYQNRTMAKKELKPCHRCGGEKGRSVVSLPTDWHLGELEDGTTWPMATGNLPFCRKCAYWVERENKARLKELGVVEHEGGIRTFQRYMPTDDVIEVKLD